VYTQKNKTLPDHDGHHRPTAAMVPRPRRRRTQQSTNMIVDKSMLLKVEDLIVFTIYKPIGAAPQGHFFVGGGGGVWAKKVVTLRGLRISEKKEILRKPTVLCKCIF
jgi:hypothetical protein